MPREATATIIAAVRVAIIGGGVIGASIAWHLAAPGIRDVIVLDRAPGPGGGSTPLATGGFRTQFATEVNVRLSLLARKELENFDEWVGADSGYRQCGYLFVTREAATLDALRDSQRVQHACGATDSRMISPDEARKLNPAIDDPELIGGAFCPTDGFVRAPRILRGYSQGAARLGVKFDYGVEVRALRTEGDRVIALETSRGDVFADVFVNAAGAWAAAFGDVPIVPLRRQVASTVRTEVLPEWMPMTIWVDDGFHLRVREERVLLLQPDEPPPGFETNVDEQWLARVTALAHERVPRLRDVPIDRDACWAGLYEMSPDHHAILGPSVPYSNLFLANGSSGHGVMHAPAIGLVIAEMIAGRKTSIDVTALRASRFAEGAEITGVSLL
jgi:sarcosine oxidase subunit beta